MCLRCHNVNQQANMCTWTHINVILSLNMVMINGTVTRCLNAVWQLLHPALSYRLQADRQADGPRTTLRGSCFVSRVPLAVTRDDSGSVPAVILCFIPFDPREASSLVSLSLSVKRRSAQAQNRSSVCDTFI